MVPVRRPGRPLSSCPHRPSQPCACATVTAAISRKHACRCEQARTVSGKSTPISEPETAGSSAAVSSPSSKATTPSFRVQKASVYKGAATRKPLIDTAALERMDANPLAMLPTSEPTADSSATLANGTPSLPQCDVMPLLHAIANGSVPQPMLIPMFQPPLSPAMGQPQTVQPATDASSGHVGADGFKAPDSSNEQVGCCAGQHMDGKVSGGGSASTSTSVPEVDQTSQTPSSCCSSHVQTEGAETHASLRGLGKHQNIAANMPQAIVMPQFPITMVMPGGLYPFFPQPTIFNYPPQYGSYLHPLQPEQWRQMMTDIYESQQSRQSAHDMSRTQYPVPSEPQLAGGTTHRCQCGDSCQCIGCAAHPYNKATQNYILSAWNSMMEEAQNTQGPAKAGQTQPPSNGSGAHPEDETAASPDGKPSPNISSGAGEEQSLSESDFFFVSYPFAGMCDGDVASCPCGDACQCIGCAVHSSSEAKDPCF